MIKKTKKISSILKDVYIYNNNIILEGSTTNLILIKNSHIILPRGNYYKGVTMNYLLKKIQNKYFFKSMLFSDLLVADEIILVGSGKGVVKVTSIPQIKWFSSSAKMFKRLSSMYKAQLEL